MRRAAERRPRPRLPRRRDRRPAANSLRAIADTALRTGFPGRIVAGHCCSLATAADGRGRGDHRARRRGRHRRRLAADVQHVPAGPPRRPHAALARRHAAPRALAARRRRSRSPPTTPATRSTPMAISTWSRSSARRCASSTSTTRSRPGRRSSHARPAAIVGRPDRGVIAAGGPADLVLFRARTLTELLARPQADRTVIRSGKAIDRTPARLPRTRRPHGRPHGHDRHRAPQGRPRRHQDRGQSGDREAEEPRLLLVLAGAEAPARPRHRRPRRLAEERGGGHPRPQGLLRGTACR